MKVGDKVYVAAVDTLYARGFKIVVEETTVKTVGKTEFTVERIGALHYHARFLLAKAADVVSPTRLAALESLYRRLMRARAGALDTVSELDKQITATRKLAEKEPS